MERRQAIIVAAACEIIGLAMMLFINRLLPIPIDVIVTLLGFLLLCFGPFIILFRRKE